MLYPLSTSVSLNPTPPPPHPSTQVVSHDDGNVYSLRRFDGARTTPKIVAAAVDTWRRIQVCLVVL